MSLSYKIKLLSQEEKAVFVSMLEICLKIRAVWVKSLTDKSKTDAQCDFALSKLKEAENKFRNQFKKIHLDNFSLGEIKSCF